MPSTRLKVVLLASLLLFCASPMLSIDGEALAPAPSRNGRAYVTDQQPANFPLATSLTAKERRENFVALWSILDGWYAQFKLKSIDWLAIGHKYQARLDTLNNDDDFYRMMFQLVNELKDTHSWLQNYSYKEPLLSGDSGLPVGIFQGKPFILGGPKAGWEVVGVDGMTVAERVESLRPYLRACSSERAFLRQASNHLLAGKPGEVRTAALRSPQGTTETLKIEYSDAPPLRTRLLVRHPAIVLTRQSFVHFGRYPSGLGYIRIISFSGRDEIKKEFDRALDALRDTTGLILDIRDNPGGFGHSEMIGRFLRKRAFTGISYIKSGPKQNDFRKEKDYVEPSGGWQYTRPVALLINDQTGSAADLFALRMRAIGNVTTLGTTTHGNLSGVALYGVLPCGLVVRFSNGFISDPKDRPIELNGNVPDIEVEPSVQDYLNGRDPVLERAVEVLTKKIAG